MDRDHVTVLVSHQTVPGQRDAVVGVWMKHMAEAVASNQGHVSYVYCLDEDDSDAVLAFQVYADAAAATAFLQTSAYASYENEVRPLLASPPVVRRLAQLWRKEGSGGA
ncbi:antibiotic biosynthesis monooxygenase [Nocardioides sp. HDW12B]|uniref:putative quinol monooxygenase n=1 Tax=Nocardioides sp. HDW12B TaxID=2714939 RepID=UPI00140C3114|nr:antibiotic biosynthesis monooxygenase [Nocardioides sp. HDW12B]QIK66464.1 antibiotic biosynthesis monooxygenase [Nocardioides sp. HDW12B]